MNTFRTTLVAAALALSSLDASAVIVHARVFLNPNQFYGLYVGDERLRDADIGPQNRVARRTGGGQLDVFDFDAGEHETIRFNAFTNICSPPSLPLCGTNIRALLNVDPTGGVWFETNSFQTFLQSPDVFPTGKPFGFITSLRPVPEPSTWLAMLGGLLGVGLFSFKRRR